MSEILKLILAGERLNTAEMGKLLGLTHEQVEAEFKRLQGEGVLLGWRPILNPNYDSSSRVRAEIEIKIKPERGGGFDRLAERISNFSQVESCYLMSGSYDLLLFVVAENLQQVASFVFERLATLDGVESTATHFMLRAYKEQGFMLIGNKNDADKPVVSP